MNTRKKNIRIVLAVLFVLSVQLFAVAPKNVIFCIGDGMGFEQVKAAGMYLDGEEGSLFFETFPCSGEVTTCSADKEITDSAAAATALATGVKVNNGVISLRLPGDGGKLTTLLEYFKAEGKKVGLVSTTYISHATPAAFGAHAKSRGNHEEIIDCYLTKTKPDVLLGGAKTIKPQAAVEAGYTVVTDRTDLMAVDTNAIARLSGQFGKDHLPFEAKGKTDLPHLSEMTEVALDILDNGTEGFFLMIEGGRIDHAGHKNLLKENIYETIEFANTVRKVYQWAQDRKDTLIIVTADHETGGLQVTENNGKNVLPDVTWSTKKHTAANVPLFAWGRKAKLFAGQIDNTDFFELITDIEIKNQNTNGNDVNTSNREKALQK